MADVVPKRGMRFEHKRFIIGSPKAGTARPDVCTVSGVSRDTVYYRTEQRMLMAVPRSRFDEYVLRVLD